MWAALGAAVVLGFPGSWIASGEPYGGTPFVRVSANEVAARVPIEEISADGDRVAYWLCPYVLGAWRVGDPQQVPLTPRPLPICGIPGYPQGFGVYVEDLALAGDRLAYLTTWAANEIHIAVMLARVVPGSDGALLVETGTSRGSPLGLGDVVGSGSDLVYGLRGGFIAGPTAPEALWRVDGATPVQITGGSDDLQPLAVDRGRILARRPGGSLELLSLDGSVLRTFVVPSLGAALAGDDLVVLVQGELREYSASTGELLQVWPLPDVPSANRCRLSYCPPVRLTLDDAARGLVVYTFDGVVHLLRLADGSDRTIPGATVAELTDAGLFYAYRGDEPWPGRIRFVPMAEL